MQLKDIINKIEDDKFDLYFKGSYIGDFSVDEALKSNWINEKVVSIGTEDGVLSIYLSEGSREF